MSGEADIWAVIPVKEALAAKARLDDTLKHILQHREREPRPQMAWHRIGEARLGGEGLLDRNDRPDVCLAAQL